MPAFPRHVQERVDIASQNLASGFDRPRAFIAVRPEFAGISKPKRFDLDTMER
jgi:hypothetical protein